MLSISRVRVVVLQSMPHFLLSWLKEIGTEFHLDRLPSPPLVILLAWLHIATKNI